MEQPESLYRRLPPTPIPIGLPSRSFTVTNTDSDNTALLTTASTQIYEEVKIADPKELKEIVRDFDLPVRLSVCGSFYGIGDHFSLFNNDKIDVHFMKETLVASIRHSTGRELIKIPLNGDFEVSLTYDSSSVVFDCQMTTSQLMKANTLPMLLKVEKGCKGSKQSSDFFEGEILMSPKQVTPTKIECFSQITDSIKWIHRSSKLVFIANPLHQKLCLADIEHFEPPLQVKLHPFKKRLEEYFKMPSTIESLRKEQSVLVSLCNNGEPLEEGKVIEVFTDVPMEFEVVQLSEKEEESLSEKSRILYESFTPSCITKVITDTKSTENRWKQDLFEVSRLRKEGAKGIEIFPPATFVVKRRPDASHPIKHCQLQEFYITKEQDYTPLQVGNPESTHVYMQRIQNGAVRTNDHDYEELELSLSDSQSSSNSASAPLCSSPQLQKGKQCMV